MGYRVIVVRDVCSSSNEGHDMPMHFHHTRYTEQIETADAAAILARWGLTRSSRLCVLVDLALRELRQRLIGLLFLAQRRLQQLHRLI